MKKLLYIPLAALLALTLAACGDDKDDDSANTTRTDGLTLFASPTDEVSEGAEETAVAPSAEIEEVAVEVEEVAGELEEAASEFEEATSELEEVANEFEEVAGEIEEIAGEFEEVEPTTEPAPIEPEPAAEPATIDPEPPIEPTPAPPTAQIVWVTETGNRYHLDSCRHVLNSGRGVTREQAESQGLTPCGTCKP